MAVGSCPRDPHCQELLCSIPLLPAPEEAALLSIDNDILQYSFKGIVIKCSANHEKAYCAMMAKLAIQTVSPLQHVSGISFSQHSAHFKRVACTDSICRRSSTSMMLVWCIDMSGNSFRWGPQLSCSETYMLLYINQALVIFLQCLCSLHLDQGLLRFIQSSFAGAGHLHQTGSAASGTSACRNSKVRRP